MRHIRLELLLCAVPALAAAQPAPTPSVPPPPGLSAGAAAPVAPAPPLPQVMPAEPVQPSVAPAGQWVYTRQFGWLYMPYGQQYTYIPGDPQMFPDQFVYYPAYGWRWVVAPWVYGYGPAPYWGSLGLGRFVWYSRPWFRVGGYWGWGGYHGWGHYRGWIGPHAWGPRGWVAAPSYYRTGVGGPHPAHEVRAAPPRRVERHGVERRGAERHRPEGHGH